MKYPCDPSLRNHFLLAFGLGIWVFVFLYFTEPLDVNEFSDREKLIFLPLYGLFGSLCYILTLPFQFWMLLKLKFTWRLKNEILFHLIFVIITFLAMRSYYLYVVMYDEINPYTLGYYIFKIFSPAFLTLFPVVLIGRWGLGKYYENQISDDIIEIKGAGNYENFRIPLNQLVFVQSSDNYIEVTYLENQESKKSLIRTRLSDVENTIPKLLKTHRSYLINPAHFRSWKNEKGKLLVTLSGEATIPVSKTFVHSVKDELNFTPK